ncbi:MAG: hypothetical protein HKO98_09130 [Gemmatimonadetes bacterium]|nr:hypothetical protein [Gemmatimonadota bacterium]
MTRPLPSLLRSVTTGALLLLFASACSDSSQTAGTSIDRETFIATYVDLRLSALGTQTGVITDAERVRVLEKHAVTEDDLIAFADAWGPHPESMRGVWEEVQRRLRAAAGEDTASMGGAGS